MTSQSRMVDVRRCTPKPIAAETVPRCPALAPNGRSNAYADAYLSGTYPWSGPLGGTLCLTVGMLEGICTTLAFDGPGRIIALSGRVEPAGQTYERALVMLDPDTLAPLAEHALPPGMAGGLFINQHDQAVVSTGDQQVMIFDIGEPADGFSLAQRFDLGAAIDAPDASIVAVMPDWRGTLWWVTDHGMVGYRDLASGAAGALHLPEAQLMGEAIAVDETGGVFVASDRALYRFDRDQPGDPPHLTWINRHGFASGRRRRSPVPTLVGQSLCGLADGGDPAHVLIYRRGTDYRGNRLVGRQAVFAPGGSTVETALVGYTGAFIVGNNHGYSGSFTTPTGPVMPGLAKVIVDPSGRQGAKIWENTRLAVPSSSSKLSLANGLLYTYTLEIADGRQDWYVTAVDAATGDLAYKVLAGSGLAFDNHYAGLVIGPNGTVYVPVWCGMVSLRQT